MKALFDHDMPFGLAHGGFQIQIELAKKALEEAGVEVEYLRWWDDRQTGDLIHYFGRPQAAYIRFAHAKNLRVVLGELLTGLGSRSGLQRAAQKAVIQLARRFAPASLTVRLGWDAYRLADAMVSSTAWEARLMVEMFDAPPERVHVVPNGVEAVFLDRRHTAARGPWLVCTATITERKRVVELAEAAADAQTPLWVVGKSYGAGDPYSDRFMRLVQLHPKWIRYEGPVESRGRLAQIYKEARGFVLLSTMETLSLAAQEAAACGCPMLLSDLPWARTTFGADSTYCPVRASRETTARVLRQFYEAAPGLKPPSPPWSWGEFAARLKSVYEGCLAMK